VPGVVENHVEFQDTVPQLQVEVNLDAASLVRDLAQICMEGWNEAAAYAALVAAVVLPADTRERNVLAVRAAACPGFRVELEPALLERLVREGR